MDPQSGRHGAASAPALRVRVGRRHRQLGVPGVIAPLMLTIMMGFKMATSVAWVYPSPFQTGSAGRHLFSYNSGGKSTVRSTSAFNGRALVFSTARSEAYDKRGEGTRRGTGLRGLVAMVPFFPRFKQDQELGEEIVPSRFRSVGETFKLPRLPFWPLQTGLVLTLISYVFRLPDLAMRLEDQWGGRVGVWSPNILERADPFLLLAHHRHKFWALDPFRSLIRAIMPEGFPGHPHRGFQTVTYVMKGGMVHRDSMGIKQKYTEGQVQWMSAGRGIIHEEMWDLQDMADNDIEIYQIWVNLPSVLKMTRPRIQLAGKGTGAPLPIVSPSVGTKVVVIAGEVCGEVSPIETPQPLSMLHVTMDPGAKSWAHSVPRDHTCQIYVRRGQLTIVPTEEGLYDGEEDQMPQVVLAGHCIFLDNDGDYARFENRKDAQLDFMLIEGEPTNEKIHRGANVVMNSEQELAQSDEDLSKGYFGNFWDFRMSDDEWREIVQGADKKKPGNNKMR